MEISNIDLVSLEWSRWNGFTFRVLYLEIGWFEGSLLGLSFGWNSYLHIDLAFIHFEIMKPL